MDALTPEQWVAVVCALLLICVVGKMLGTNITR